MSKCKKYFVCVCINASLLCQAYLESSQARLIQR